MDGELSIQSPSHLTRKWYPKNTPSGSVFFLLIRDSCREEKEDFMQTKPSIVFCHGLWADGSCFSKLIVPLQAEGYECIAAQYGLNSTAEDVALTKATIGRVSSPVILVGHSYGGSVITGAGTDDRVVGLVYICARSGCR
jgi:pimeloyl-ACP methyl ester carboxylesterase